MNNTRRISPLDNWIMDANGNLMGVQNPNANGDDLLPVTYTTDPLTGGITNIVAGGRNALVDLGVPINKFNRAPRPTDNSSLGFTSTSYWQHAGKLFKPLSAPTSGSCAWAPLQRKAAQVVDIVGTTNTKFAGGTVAVKSGYASSAIDISVTIATVATPATINILASGELDVSTLEGYLSRMDAGTYCTVTKVYDQTGNGNHLVKDGSYAALLLDFDAELGRYVITSEYVSGGVDRRLRIPNTVVTARNAFSMIFVGRAFNSAGDNDSTAIAVLGDYLGGAGQISPLQFRNTGGLFIPQNPAGGNVIPASTIAVSSTKSVFGVIAGASTTEFFSNGESSTATTNRTDALTGGWVGSDGAAAKKLPVKFVSFSIVAAAITAAQKTAILEGAYPQFGILPQLRDRVVLLGDSRLSGAWGELNNTFSTMLTQHMQSKAEVINMSNGSKQITDITSGTAATAQAMYRSGCRNVAVILAGINNFIVGAKSVSTCITEMTALVTALRSTGYQVVVIAELATTSTTNSANTLLPQLATAMLSNPMGANAVIDTTVYPELLAASTAANYSDGVHPTSPLYNLLAGITAPVVDGLLN